MKAAVLVKSKKPLIIENLELPELNFGQVHVKLKYSGICGAQINEIDAVKGLDKFLPHLLEFDFLYLCWDANEELHDPLLQE